MSLIKTAVFLASRFDEFAELRSKLKERIANYPVVQLAPIDLNDGNVSHRPPLVECLGFVRRSDFMILLLGDTYGSQAPKTNKSFTHLEYEEAIRESASTRVLVFGVGENYRGGRINYSNDERLASWQKQLEENHTVGFFDPETNIDDIAKSIFERLLAALYEMRFGALSVEDREGVPDDVFDAIEDESLLDDTEVKALEERNSRGPSLIDDRLRIKTTLEAITQPAAVAALEQREEAQQALDIGEYGVAIKHLKRALEFKPLELNSNYWLANLYVALGRKEKATEAIEMAVRAGRIAERDEMPYRAAAAYITAARAARLADHPDEALNFARQSVDIAPRFARAHIELARQHALQNESKPSLDAIRQAFALYPKSLRVIFGDPVFRSMRKDIDYLIQGIKAKISRDVTDLTNVESIISELSGGSVVILNTEGKTISQLIDCARQSSRRQYEMICKLIADAVNRIQDIKVNLNKSTAATKEQFKFKNPGVISIVKWLKQPGDIVQPNESIFMYKYNDSNKVKTWSSYYKGPVCIANRVDEDAVVSNYNPYIFEYVVSKDENYEPSPVQLLVKSISDAENDLTLSEYNLNRVEIKKQEAVNAKNTFVRGGITTPGTGRFIIGALLMLLGCALIYSGRYGYGFSSLIFGIFFVIVGYLNRGEYKTTLEKLVKYLIVIDEELKNCLEVVSQKKDQITLLNIEMSSLQLASESAKKIAIKALESFEAESLKKSGKLLSFPSVFGAKLGVVIRVSNGQLEQLKSDPSREIQILQDEHDWLSIENREKAKFRLMRVVENTPERLVLSFEHAYIDIN